jgi:nucleoside-diphosphate-sugar epimerase
LTPRERKVLVTGGAGYVGSRLVPELLASGYDVRVLDTCWYGIPQIGSSTRESQYSLVEGDIRDSEVVSSALDGITDVIHLACISNDPSYDLDPALGKAINLDAFEPLVRTAKDKGVKRFIYASSSSVYGVKKEEKVTENLSLEPLTDYSRFKAECEEILLDASEPDFITTTLRPATICGPSPRQRMDLAVNLLTNHAVNYGVIKVFGGNQYRPNLHIKDMCRVYLEVLNQPSQNVDREIFNVGSDNLTLLEIAGAVRDALGGNTPIEIEATSDLRSYRISSEHIGKKLGFYPLFDVNHAILELLDWFNSGLFPNSLDDSKYFNIARMKEVIPELQKNEPF